MLITQARGRKITTIEGLENEKGLHPLQESFIDHFAVQCGFCIPGMVLASECILASNPHPTEKEIRDGISGNLCRCTGYNAIVQAITAASQEGNGLW